MFLNLILFITPNTCTASSTNITLTFTLTIYLGGDIMHR